MIWNWKDIQDEAEKKYVKAKEEKNEWKEKKRAPTHSERERTEIFLISKNVS